MTDLPPWAAAALGVEDLSLRGWEKLGPLTQEKGDPFWGSLPNRAWTIRDATPYAGFTCEECPQRERYYSYSIREEGKTETYERTVHCYTDRCPECSRKMKRWQRGQNDANLVQIGSDCYEQGTSFVTLTTPNMVGCPLASIRSFKKMVASYRRRFPRDCISGGIDYYEWTTHPDDRAWSAPIVHNVHMHGIWVMDFWAQASMQKSWEECLPSNKEESPRGIVHVKRLRDSGSAVRYATKYASKADVKGIRLKEKFGCLYGSAKRAMLDAYQARQNLGL